VAQRMVLVTCRRPFNPGLSRRMLWRSANSIGDTSALRAISEMRWRYGLNSFQRHRWGSVLSWAAATRPEASSPPPSPLVWLNQGRWAGAFACVRTHTWCLAASVLMASIISRALLDKPAGAFTWVAAAAVIAFSPVEHMRKP